MGKPNALSHCTDHGSGWDDNSNMTMLSPELFWVHTLSGLDIVGEEHDILQDIWHSLCDNDLEESVAKAAQELHRDHSCSTVCSVEWSELDGLLMFHGKIYNAEGTAWFYLKEVWKLHGLPAQSGVIADHSLLQTLHANCTGCS